jgi:molybdate transport system regulatory protein
MSYRHAWSMIRASEERLGRSLVETSRGGSGGGGAHLTEFARDLLARFDRMKENFENLTATKQAEIRDWAN